MIPLRDDNPAQITPVVTWGLIIANVLVFLYQSSLAPQAARIFIYQFGAIPAVVYGTQALPARYEAIPSYLSLLTSMFLHGGFMHLAGNMLYLWIFGNNIEEAVGHLRYLFFYVISGLAAAVTHISLNPGSAIPTVGASGAISGVLGAYLLLYPKAQVLVLIPLGFFMRLMYIPAGFVLGIWFVIQLLSSTAGGAGGGVAWWAHIGGFVAGMALIGLFKKKGVRFFNPPHYRSRRYSEW